MEKFNNPYIDRLVGAPLENAEETKKYHDYVIEDILVEGGKPIEGVELEKTKKDIELINLTEKAADELLQKFGRSKKIEVPLDNIHLLKHGGSKDLANNDATPGAYEPTLKSIVIDRTPSDVQFSLVLFHEMMHLKSYSALQIIPKENGEQSLETYRSGLNVISRDGTVSYLKDFEEAIVGYLTAIFYFETIRKLPQFQEEVRAIDEGKLSIDISRTEEIKTLNKFITLIYDRNKGRFSSTAEVERLFIDAQVNGNLLPLARVIEKTFGVGTIKKIKE